MTSKWETVSGFPEFFSQLDEELLSFIVTQTFLTDTAMLTAGLAVLATQTGAISFGSEALDIVTQFASTATNMAPSDRAEFISELKSIGSSIGRTAIAGAATAAPAPGSAAGLARMDLLSVSCAVAALIAAVAVAL